MDSTERPSRKTQDERDNRGRRPSQWSIGTSESESRPDSSDTTLQRQRSRPSSVTSVPISRQLSGGSRHRSTQPDGRLEERRGLAHRLHIFPHRPHSSNASRNSSTNTSSSSLFSLTDPADMEPGSDHANSHLGTSPSHSLITPRAVDIAHAPPLSPLSEHPPPLSRATTHTSTDFPVYPDQAYAVLQSQVHPAPYQPPLLRSRSSYPSNYPLSATSSGTPWSSASRGYGSRTAGNTPISSPGLFYTHRSQSPLSVESEEGRVSFLHPTHLQEPKETHTVERDRDSLTGNKLINEYEILDELGRGEHGKVKLGRHLRTGQKVAIKIVQRYSKRRRLGKLGNPEDKVKKEVAILKKARHPNVVSLLEVIDDPNLQKVYIVLEYVENGEIVWRRKGLGEIVKVERHRLEQEKRGIPHSSSFDEYSEKFIKVVQSKRHKSEMHRKTKRAAAPHYSGIPAWSLEHGGESDDEIASEHHGPPGLLAPGSLDSPEAHASPSHSFTSASDLESRMRDSMAAIEGSMYGPYTQDLLYERRYSTASSHFGCSPSEPDWLSDDDDMAYVPCLTMSEARSAFRDAVLGLEYLHYQGIIHRDIKPANLLVAANGRVKISDFGVSYLGRPIRDDEDEQVGETDATELDDARELSKTVGTPAFYAPELCYTGTEFEAAIGNVPKITGQIDVWSLGVTLYGMIFGRLPFLSDGKYDLFHNIVKQEPFIPTKRLKAIEVEVPSRQSSGPQLTSMNSNKRLQEDLHYEDVDDDLQDLLRRLLVKDPTKRITLKEIKQHPWVTRGISNPTAWAEETDPSKQSMGKKIEVSSDEVTKAVTKMPFIERVRSNVARWGGTIFRSKDGRKRATSSAASAETGPSSSSSSGVTVAKDFLRDFRRSSLRGDEELSRPKTNREGEHPLSHSVLASPEPKEDRAFFAPKSDREAGSKTDTQLSSHNSRPELRDRSTSGLSNAGSTKTVRQMNQDMMSLHPVPSRPQLDPSGSSGLSGIFGGAGRRLAKTLHTSEWRRERSPSTDRSSACGDGHSEPSIAVSSASAAGQVDSACILRDLSSGSLASDGIHGSPIVGNAAWTHHRNRSQPLPHESSAESFNYAREAHRIRKAKQEFPHHRRSELSDWRLLPDHEADAAKYGDVAWEHLETDPPTGSITSPPSAATISSSSADDFTSGMSHSASHPSIPSVISGASSLSADGLHTYVKEREKDNAGRVPPLLRTGDTVTARNMPDKPQYDEESRYDCDDEDDDEYESDDEGIVFGKKKVPSPSENKSGMST
ncbi:CAMKK protein kinase [Polytolypa hystricis UAMH7299]|uniref:non-specific serine/threonine protein kinase n=1 Tax=Polytolypa hystricis (strain UAMH7299) TaxID=1447883 RepID=A0A2B7Z2B0_POLH7|nr:CAMKK protein kinase [Polytolypa hystricis UAMH7299]